MSPRDETQFLSWTLSGDRVSLTVQGQWVLAHYDVLNACVDRYHRDCGDATIEAVDASALTSLDTAGASRLAGLLNEHGIDLITEEQASLSPERRAMLRAVADAMTIVAEAEQPVQQKWVVEVLGNIGKAVSRFWQQFMGLLAFSGLTLEALVRNVLRPRTWRVTSIVAQIEETGLDAVPIVALLTFLVGAVIAFLGATILADFGATTYTINLVGFSFLREFAVLLTAILMAGRTASAFTAQIGSMKVNEEIDAIRVQGLSPVVLLVLPRVLAMQISLPILTFVGMLSGVAGGMLVCALVLDISPQVFMDTFADDIPVRHFFIGMAKAPVFAFLIAVIGCLEGFKVEGSAQSVGEHTTAAVVHSIFVVILLDALAALFFMEMGW